MLTLTKNTLVNQQPIESTMEKAKRLHSTSSHESGISAGNKSNDLDHHDEPVDNVTATTPIAVEKITNTLPEGFSEDRFRVDRKRLEALLSQNIKDNNNNNLTKAEAFFLEIMNTTSTQVSWPSKLKVGAKSKKDPHIKITGPTEQVKIAKEKIMQQLDSKSSRVTIKMDVSHTDHSHVIGKGGSNIKHVMKETECHIHFPDSNRNSNNTEKSNQVSIAGQTSGVELARQRIRELLPITLAFDFPSKQISNIDLNSPAIQNIVQSYNISVQIKSNKHNFKSLTTIQVRGCVSNQIGLKEGIICLMQCLTGQIGQTIPITTSIEIQNVSSFMNPKSVSKIKAIQQNTGIQIELPCEKTNNKIVTMTGACESILYARQEIISQLPLVLMFDLKEDVSTNMTNKLGEQFECYISVKSKTKQASKSCIIKSSEANVYNMFKARQILMNLSYNGLEDIPMPVNAASFLYNQKMQFQLQQIAQQQQASLQQANNTTFLPPWSTQNTKPNTTHNHPQKSLQINAKSINTKPNTISRDSANTKSIDSTPSSDTSSTNKTNLSGIIRQPNGPSTVGFKVRNLSRSSQKTGIKIQSIQSNNSNLNRSESHCTSKDDCLSSGNECNTSDLSDNEGKSNIVSECYYKPISYRTGPTTGFSKLNKNKNNFNKNGGNVSSSTSDNSDSVIACNNQSSLNKNNTHTHNNTNMPQNHNNMNMNATSQNTNTMKSNTENNNTNNNNSRVIQPTSLEELFESLNLSKYIESFIEQEIDLSTFVTMSDNDLRELGVNTFGARRKMSMAIKEINSGIRHHTSTTNISLRVGQ